MIRFKRGDLLILTVCLLLIPASVLWLRVAPSVATAIEISVAGKPAGVYPLQPDRRISINGANGNSVIEIRDHAVRFASSACPTKHCVLGGWHTQSGDTAICLPNRVGITLISNDDYYDGINF